MVKANCKWENCFSLGFVNITEKIFWLATCTLFLGHVKKVSMDDVLTVQLFGMICCSPTSSWLLCLPWSEPGSRFLSGGLDLKVQFLYPSVFSWTHYKRWKERFVKFLEFVGWKHRELVQIIKSTAAKHIYIWKVGVGVLDFWASSAQRPKLGPCGLDWDKFVLLLCVSSWGCGGGNEPTVGIFACRGFREFDLKMNPEAGGAWKSPRAFAELSCVRGGFCGYFMSSACCGVWVSPPCPGELGLPY